jgi:hypothetical protein
MAQGKKQSRQQLRSTERKARKDLKRKPTQGELGSAILGLPKLQATELDAATLSDRQVDGYRLYIASRDRKHLRVRLAGDQAAWCSTRGSGGTAYQVARFFVVGDGTEVTKYRCQCRDL